MAVNSPGEIQLAGTEASYTPWSSTQIERKPQVVQYIAGTMGASKINKPFQDALSDSSIERSRYGAVSIIDLKQALWGTRGMITKELVKNKKKHAFSSIIADKEGQGLKSWGLKEKSSAVIILDSDGEIKYFKDGELSDDEISSVLELLKSLL